MDWLLPCFGRQHGPTTRSVLRAASAGAAADVRAAVATKPTLAVARDFGLHNAWHRAAERGHVEVLEALAAALLVGADGDGISSSSTGDPGGAAADGSSSDGKQISQQRAVADQRLDHRKSVEEREALLRKGIDAKDDCGLTPLMLACVYNRPDCVRVLMRLGANPLLLDYLGRGALHYAALVDGAECINELLSGYTGPRPDWPASEVPGNATARLVDMVSIYGCSALHYAVYNDKMDSVKALASYEPSLFIQTTDVDPLVAPGIGNTALHLAAHKGSFDMVKTLLAIHVQSMSAGQEAITAGRREWGEPHYSDVRTVRNRRGFMAYHLALARHGEALSELLHPDVPYSFIFNNEDMQGGAVRMYGPAKLCVLAAGTLQKKLLSDLAAVESAAAIALATNDGSCSSGGGAGSQQGGTEEAAPPAAAAAAEAAAGPALTSPRQPSVFELAAATLPAFDSDSLPPSPPQQGPEGQLPQQQQQQQQQQGDGQAAGGAVGAAAASGRMPSRAVSGATATTAASSGLEKRLRFADAPDGSFTEGSAAAAAAAAAVGPTSVGAGEKEVEGRVAAAGAGAGAAAAAAELQGAPAVARRARSGMTSEAQSLISEITSRRSALGSLGSFVGRHRPASVTAAAARSRASDTSTKPPVVTPPVTGDATGDAASDAASDFFEPLGERGLDVVLSARSSDAEAAQQAFRLMVLASGISNVSVAGHNSVLLSRQPSVNDRSYLYLRSCPSAPVGLVRLASTPLDASTAGGGGGEGTAVAASGSGAGSAAGDASRKPPAGTANVPPQANGSIGAGQQQQLATAAAAAAAAAGDSSFESMGGGLTAAASEAAASAPSGVFRRGSRLGLYRRGSASLMGASPVLGMSPAASGLLAAQPSEPSGSVKGGVNGGGVAAAAAAGTPLRARAATGPAAGGGMGRASLEVLKESEGHDSGSGPPSSSALAMPFPAPPPRPPPRSPFADQSSEAPEGTGLNKQSEAAGLSKQSEAIGLSIKSEAGGTQSEAGGTLSEAAAEAGTEVAASEAMAAGSSWDDEDASTCEICFDAVASVQIVECGHHQCIACSHELCKLHHFRPALCPFCRQIIRGFRVNSLLLSTDG